MPAPSSFPMEYQDHRWDPRRAFDLLSRFAPSRILAPGASSVVAQVDFLPGERRSPRAPEEDGDLRLGRQEQGVPVDMDARQLGPGYAASRSMSA